MFSSQQQQQQQPGSSKNVCVITNVDSLLGYAMAFRFLQAMQQEGESESFHKKLRILCRDREGMELKRLEKMGAEICQVNYKDEDKLCEAMKNVRAVMLIPENSRDRLKEACCLMKAAKHQGVEHFGLMSFVGVDKIPSKNEGDDSSATGKFRNFMEYKEIEKKVKEMFHGEKHCIVRHQIFNQLYYFMAPQIEGENMLCLPVKKDAKWGSINLIDCVEGLFQLAKKEHQQSQGQQVDPLFKKQMYEFTMNRTMKTEEMAKEIGEGLGREQLKYQEMSEKEFMSHLERMKGDRRFKERPDSEGKLHEGRDGWWSVPIGKFLNEENIETTMEYLRLACMGQLDHSSEDLHKILGRNPHDLKQYFKVNRDMFKRFK